MCFFQPGMAKNGMERREDAYEINFRVRHLSKELVSIGFSGSSYLKSADIKIKI